MHLGKLPPEMINPILDSLPQEQRIVLGPGPGRDAAVVELDDRFLVLATDPVSFSSQLIGNHVVHVNANDVACLGADPRWFLATIMIPEKTDPDSIEVIFAELQSACDAVGASLIGGHTEFSETVTQPIISGTMVGEAPHDRLFLSNAGEPHDAVIQIGAIALEGTGLIANKIPDHLLKKGIKQADINQAIALLNDPGITILPAARKTWCYPGVHTLHDVTEGGIATACAELADASQLGITIDREKILVNPITQQVAISLNLNPLGILGSGTLLVTVEPNQVDEILSGLKEEGLNASCIGNLGASNDPTVLLENGESHPLPRFPRDEIIRGLNRKP